MDPETKLCKDCRWIICPGYGLSGLVRTPLCDHPNAPHSLVNGRPLKDAETIRAYSEKCGFDARWFETASIEAPVEPAKPEATIAVDAKKAWVEGESDV